MGISWHEAKALVEVYRQNGPFGRTATLGRQNLYFDVRSLKRMLTDADSAARSSLEKLLAHPSRFAEDFFHLLGATEVVSFDYSEFEGATVTHDMNLPLPEEHHNAFDVVYDGGTLEHIFNFPQAIKNCMLMPKESGLFITATPANNWMGHGFYQFSPELFFRILCEENSFRLERMIAFEYGEGGAWFEVKDPKTLGKRVELWDTSGRIILFVVARKTRPIENTWTMFPQQSDYAAVWTSSGSAAGDELGQTQMIGSRVVRFAREHFPVIVRKMRRLRGSQRSRRERRRGRLQLNKDAFKRLH